MCRARTLLLLAALATGCRYETTNPNFGSPAQLAFQVHPVNMSVGQIPPVEVEIQDAEGRRVTSSTLPVSIVLSANPPVSMSGQATVSAVNGVATFTNLFIITPGTGYKLVASSVPLQAATSSPFSVQ